ncbi:MAG: alpha/beta hydrolase [Cyanobacteria bacterium SID2]|nr:alpha/beta hydrolase [Cyanobacteria bacterium SID2]MBP0005827.1 alpha/beta hydrolase [Cyanobacteria bacterium SBC]
MSLEAIEIAPQTDRKPVGAIVLLHGWGANARDLASLFPLLNLPDYFYLCPDAPLPHPYAPGGKMWYDLETESRCGLSESREQLTQWLDGLEARTGVPLSRTIVGGFSQGGAMTLDLGFCYPLAGLVSMSGYLLDRPQQPENLPPILLMHGRRDPIVPVVAARHAKDVLSELGAIVNYREFNIEHQICPQEVELLRHFVLDVCPPNLPVS